MRSFCIICCLLFGVLIPDAFAQNKPTVADSLKNAIARAKEDSNKVSMLIAYAKTFLSTDPSQTIPIAKEALALSNTINYTRGKALSYKNIGIAHYLQTKYIEALDNWNHALEVFESLNDIDGIANIQSNIGAIYKNQGNDDKALEMFFNSLKNAEQLNDKLRITTALNNIGSVYQHKPATYDMALNYYLRAIKMGEDLGDYDIVGTTAVNIGEIYLNTGHNDSALYFFNKSKIAFQSTVEIPYPLNNIGKVYAAKKAYDTAIQFHQMAIDSAKKVNSALYLTQSLQSLGDVLYKTGNYKAALNAYSQAEKISINNSLAYELKSAYEGLANTYAQLKNYNKAYQYQGLVLSIKDTIYNNELDLKLSKYDFNFEMQKKEGRIGLLEKDKALQDLNIKRQKLAKNAVLAGLGLILAIAGILFRDYRAKIKVNKILDSKNIQIEGLLRNILPDEVAKELQQDGQAKPRYFESVSVLFTDFKSFSAIAEKLSPQEVVAELSDCFVAFDNIIEKYGLEKIKTIGDSYMCAGGIPVEDEVHPVNIIKAAFEIVEYMRLKNEARDTFSSVPWELRVGIHTGPVVAGVVGKKKYAYDIWGSTVNIASRMESNGEPGNINISEATYNLVKHQFHCNYRGKIYAKNVGEIDMYFVEKPV